jgi:hypothetical protein
MGAKYIRGSATSQAAARQLVNLGAKRAAVLRFIESRGRDGATDEEIQIGLGMNPSTERPRRVELFEARLICKGVFQRQTRARRWANAYLAPQFAEPGDTLEFAPVEKPCCPTCKRPF